MHIPSKTFIIGEYSVLTDRYAIVAAHKPYFSLRTDAHGQAWQPHPQAPAGKLLQRHQDAGTQYYFFDPHAGLGGFGASTAQYLSLHQQLESKRSQQIWQDYLHDAQQAGTQPSGADLLAQLYGGLCWVDCHDGTVTALPWTFANIGFLVCRTGAKVATHEHLAQLNCQRISSSALGPLCHMARDALLAADENSFIETINAYHDGLYDLGLVATTTVRWREELLAMPGVVAAKGCGAMGADVILLVYQLDQEAALRAQLTLSVVASHCDLSAYNTAMKNTKDGQRRHS